MTAYLRSKLVDLKMRELVWVMTLFLALGFILGALPYSLFDASMIVRRRSTNIETYPWVFIHVSAGIVWYLSSLFQMTDFVLNRKVWHRRNGYLAITSGLLCLLALFVIHLKLQTRAAFGLNVLPSAIYSVVCLISGYLFILQKKVEHHRAWMLRSLVFVMLMTLDRTDSGARVVFQTDNYSPIHITWFAYLICELIIHRRLEFPVLSKTKRGLNILLLTIYLSIAVCGGWLTYIFQFHYLKDTLPVTYEVPHAK